MTCIESILKKIKESNPDKEKAMLLEMVIILHRAVLEQDLPRIMQKYKSTEDVDKELEKIAEKYR